MEDAIDPVGIYLTKGHKEAFAKGGCPSGGSASTDALILALAMGCNPIALVGQDLSFSGNRNYSAFTFEEDQTVERTSRGLVTHAGSIRSGAVEKNKESFFESEDEIVEKLKERLGIHDKTSRSTANTVSVEVQGMLRDKVHTKADYLSFKSSFESIARKVRDSLKTRLVNCTEGGVSIAGYEEIPLSAFARPILKRPFPMNVKKTIRNEYQSHHPVPKSSIRDYFRKESAMLSDLKNRCDTFIGDLRKIVELNQSGKTREANDLLVGIRETQAKLGEEIRAFLLIESFMQEVLVRIDAEKRQRRPEEMNFSDFVRQNEEFFRAVSEGIERIMAIYKEYH
ncbi:MAG: hypothetical protein MZW92_71900 [Comamonadaceae bacterium]|nr:hypothetical protein [Comamonadaceae bacterium]